MILSEKCILDFTRKMPANANILVCKCLLHFLTHLDLTVQQRRKRLTAARDTGFTGTSCKAIRNKFVPFMQTSEISRMTTMCHVYFGVVLIWASNVVSKRDGQAVLTTMLGGGSMFLKSSLIQLVNLRRPCLETLQGAL